MSYCSVGHLVEKIKQCKFPVVAFDIETKPAADVILRDFYSPPVFDDVPFDPDSVKVGNLRDPAKIEAKIEEARQRHAHVAVDQEQTKNQDWEAFKSAAPLSAAYGRVCAVGYGLGEKDLELSIALDIDLFDEFRMLTHWLSIVSVIRGRGVMVGHNTHKFDIPFMLRRCWANGLKPPALITRYKAPEDFMLDTIVSWRCGGDYKDSISLRNLAKVLEVTGKMEDVDGTQFWQLMSSNNADDRKKAMQYLELDVQSSYECARKMCLVP